MSDTPVFGLIDMLRAYGNGELPQPVPLPSDEHEPVFIVRHEGQGGLLYNTLDIHKRFHGGMIGEWYSKHYAYIIQEDDVRTLVTDKESARYMRELSTRHLKGHPVVMLFEDSRLLRFLTENGVPVSQRWEPPMSVEEAHALVAQGSLSANTQIKDMPEAVLDGRLGEIYQRRMGGQYCLAYSWLPLVTIAAGRMPPSGMRTNLYSATIGEPHTGKSATTDRALHLFGVDKPLLVKMKSGSIEQLAKTSVLDAAGDARLLYLGELSHLLKKANVPGANFDTILNDAFYYTTQEMTVAKTGSLTLNCRLSILGGMTEEKFGTLFGEAGATGFYDRFLFSQGPTGYKLKYRPYEDEPVELIEPCAVSVDGDVWDARDEWLDKGMGSRVAEIALRVATVCAGVDGRSVLRAKDLGPAKALAAYQEQLRMTLKPNDGETIRGQLFVKLTSYIKKFGNDGNPLSLTKVFQSTGAYKTDPTAARAVVEEMVRSHEYEVLKTPSGRGELIRWRVTGSAG